MKTAIRRNRTPLLGIVLSCFVSGLSGLAGAAEPPVESAKQPAGPPRIQMAILLDTSGSMSGLINQARAQLWKVVNEFALAKRDGQAPTMEVALYEYGKDSLPAKEGYMRMIVPLTNDLDRISEELFKLATDGGSEYCGQVIDLAVRELSWSQNARDLKCIFIAGNEPFTQGPVKFQDACKAATAKNITVSTIFCGDHREGIDTNWEQGAKLADGSYLSINQDEQVATVAAPQDKELAELNAKLNTTYLAFGEKKKREAAVARQLAQDANAAKLAPGAAAARVATKASGFYRNATWDLLDAIEQGKLKLADVKEEDLPDEVRKVKAEDRPALLAKMAKEREEIRGRIQQLSKARDAYVTAERAKLATKADKTLDAAIIEAASEQASDLGFEFEK
jgi:hypothetical protein